MRWRGRRQSTNVEDRRGGGVPAGGLLVGGGGLGTLAIVAIVWLLGGNPQAVLQQQPGAGGPAPAGRQAGTGEDDEALDFIQVVVADTEDVWGTKLPEEFGRPYQPCKVVVISRGQQERTGCGIAGSDLGPFYCPADRSVYISPSFFSDLRTRFGAPGDFACAYVIAHEVGHHLQNLLGYSDLVNRVRQQDPGRANEYSVRLELQADYLAGCWAYYSERENQILESGDVREALTAAAAIGDDTLQKNATGTVNAESFTHGTSAQRVRWFREGLTTGDLGRLDSFFKAPYDRL